MNRKRNRMSPAKDHQNGSRYISSPDIQRFEPKGIEYQDDSLSSYNSEPESHPKRIKIKEEFRFRDDSIEKLSRDHHQEPDKHHEQHHHKDTRHFKDIRHRRSPLPRRQLYSSSKVHQRRADSPSTSERLERLETMLEVLIKRHDVPENPHQVVSMIPPPVEKTSGVTYELEPRENKFTTSMWLSKIQEISVSNNWDEKTTLRFMESQMTGIIKAWYNGLPNRSNITWPEWKLLISKTFPDNRDFITTLKRLVTRLKQADEPITNYYFSKMYLIEACKIVGEDAVSCIIDGLNNQTIQDRAKSQHFPTPESLFTEFLTNLSDYEVDYSNPSILNASPVEAWHISRKNHKVDTHLRHVDFERELIVYDSPEKNDEPPVKSTVPIHSRLGLDLNKFKGSKPYNKLCTICFKKGHLAIHCRNNDRIMLMNIPSEKESDDKSVKDCIINKQYHVKGLVDTGSTVVTITDGAMRNFGLSFGRIEKQTNESIVGFGGVPTTILGEIDLNITVDGVSRNVLASVVPEHAQHIPLILGLDFLAQERVGMVMTNERITIFEER